MISGEKNWFVLFDALKYLIEISLFRLIRLYASAVLTKIYKMSVFYTIPRHFAAMHEIWELKYTISRQYV